MLGIPPGGKDSVIQFPYPTATVIRQVGGWTCLSVERISSKSTAILNDCAKLAEEAGFIGRFDTFCRIMQLTDELFRADVNRRAAMVSESDFNFSLVNARGVNISSTYKYIFRYLLQ